MKSLMILVMGTLLAGTAFADSPNKPGEREVVVGVNDAYVPSGFDSSSDAFVVVNGLFSNSCYRLKAAEVQHVGAALHEVKVKAIVTEGLCLMVLVPFHQEAQLGKLAVGDHSIHFMNGDGTFWEKHLTIEQ